MSAATLALDAGLALVTSALFAYAGTITARRPSLTREAKRARVAFSSWWYGLAAYTAMNAGRELLAASGNLDVGVHNAWNNLTVVPLIVLLWGLVAYLACVYTGSARTVRLVTILYAAILAFYLYVEATLRPTGVRADAWGAPIQYDGGVPGWIMAGILLTELMPALVAAVLYGSLFFRTKDATIRYRIGLTSLAFLLWFGVTAIVSATPLANANAWPLASRLLGILATSLVILAYRPPEWARERWRVEPIPGPIRTGREIRAD